MRSSFSTLQVAKSNGASGTALVVDELTRKTLQFSTAFTSSLDVEISLDGVEFFKVGSTVTGPTVIDLPQTAKLLRIHTVTYVGTDDPLVTLGAFLARTDV